MSRLSDVLVGLEIFAKNGGDSIDAAHDEIRAGQADDVALSPDSIKALKDAGWFNDSEFCECEGCEVLDGEETGEHLPTCNQWMIYT